MNIQQAIKEFLTDINSGTTTQVERQNARSQIRDGIGFRIYLGRRPQGTIGPAMTIRKITSQRYDDLPGEDEIARALVDINIWTKRDSVPPAEVDRLSEELRKAIGQYRGLMGDVTVHGVTVERDGLGIPQSPEDASDDWSYVYTSGYMITHSQAVVNSL